MRRLLLALLLLPALATAAYGQKPPVNAVAGPTTSAQMQSIITDPRGSGDLTFGGATATGVLTAGNVANLTTTGVEDSGVQLLTSMTPYTLWGRMTAGTGPPGELTAILFGAGTAAAPPFSFNVSPGTGMWMFGTDQLGLSAGGATVLSLRTPDATSRWEMLFSGGGLLRIQGGTNVDAKVATLGTGEFYVENNGGSGSAPAIARFKSNVAVNTVSNILYLQSSAALSGPIITALAQGSGDTNIPVVINGAGMAGATIGTSTTMTTALPTLNVAPTWNSGGTIFTALLVNPASTASAPTSLLADFQVSSASVASINKAGLIKGSSLTVTTGTTMITSTAAFTDGAAAQAGTLANAPAAGNPTKWIPINDNGTTRYVPAW